MVDGHKINKKIEIHGFLDKIKESRIQTTNHTFFRLETKKRKIFKEKIIKEYQEPQVYSENSAKLSVPKGER